MILCRQLVRSATSVGANYRAACRARSNNEFVSKLGIVEEEVDESMFWLELMLDHGLGDKMAVKALLSECEELLRIHGSIDQDCQGQVSASQSAIRNPQSEIRNPRWRMSCLFDG